jgi:FMN reductase
MSILLLGGSPSATSSGARLLQHVGEKLALHGHRCTTLHVKDLPAQALLQADVSDRAIARACQQVADASAIVIVTPVYKAAYTGLLKAFLDLPPQDGLDDKLVLPLATGGSQSHMLVLDYALRPVLASLSPRSILPGIYATASQLHWDTERGFSLDAPIAERVARGVTQLSSELTQLQEAAIVD